MTLHTRHQHSRPLSKSLHVAVDRHWWCTQQQQYFVGSFGGSRQRVIHYSSIVRPVLRRTLLRSWTPHFNWVSGLCCAVISCASNAAFIVYHHRHWAVIAAMPTYNYDDLSNVNKQWCQTCSLLFRWLIFIYPYLCGQCIFLYIHSTEMSNSTARGAIDILGGTEAFTRSSGVP